MTCTASFVELVLCAFGTVAQLCPQPQQDQRKLCRVYPFMLVENDIENEGGREKTREILVKSVLRIASVLIICQS